MGSQCPLVAVIMALGLIEDNMTSFMGLRHKQCSYELPLHMLVHEELFCMEYFCCFTAF